jgi:hypothetical protein
MVKLGGAGSPVWLGGDDGSMKSEKEDRCCNLQGTVQGFDHPRFVGLETPGEVTNRRIIATTLSTRLLQSACATTIYICADS